MTVPAVPPRVPGVARGEGGEPVAAHQPVKVTLTPERLVTG